MIWTKIKPWLYFAIGLAVTGSVIAAKSYKAKAERLEDENEDLEAIQDHYEDVAKADNVIDIEDRSRRADAYNEVKEKGHSDLLSDPNNPKHWLHDDKDDTD